MDFSSWTPKPPADKVVSAYVRFDATESRNVIKMAIFDEEFLVNYREMLSSSALLIITDPDVRPVKPIRNVGYTTNLQLFYGNKTKIKLSETVKGNTAV